MQIAGRLKPAINPFTIMVLITLRAKRRLFWPKTLLFTLTKARVATIITHIEKSSFLEERAFLTYFYGEVGVTLVFSHHVFV